jgi:LysR family transcriptional regulator, cys regulon transcriptional activator
LNLQQLRFVQEAVRRGLNLTEAARALHTSQPGVSKAILEFEDELGIDIFERHGKRLRRVTEPGQRVLVSIDIILREVANLRRIGDEFSRHEEGTLSIATTHTQARYVLPEVVSRWREQWPAVSIRLHQGAPDDVARMVHDGSADVGLATEALADQEGLVSLPCYEWQHVLVVPRGHALADASSATGSAPATPLTLQALAAFPLVTYQTAFTGRKRIDAAFARQGLAPKVVLEAIDSDVIKTYVELGLGVGIMAEMAANAADSPALVMLPVGHLFGSNTARVAFKRGTYLRDYVTSFAVLLSTRFSRELIERAMAGGAAPDSHL